MPDRACQFAEQGRLHGVLTVPGVVEFNGTVLILVSAGLMPKHGPYRLYTELARHLEPMGFATLRFDLGGIGNSEVLDTSTPLAERTHADIRAAVDHVVRALQPERIVVGGLCSGAEDSFRYTVSDDRVDGVVLVDPHAFKTWTWWVRNIFSRLFLSRVVYKLLRICRIVSPVDRVGTEGFEGELVDYQYMDKDEATSILEILHARGVRYQYLYTGGLNDTINHRGQFYTMFRHVRFVGLEEVSCIPCIEHVQIFREDRRVLIDVISDWLRRSFA